MRPYAASLSFVLLTACQSPTYLALDAGSKSAMSSTPVETIGIGEYSYRFTLTDPRTGDPLPNHPFLLSTTVESKYDPKFDPDGNTVYQGITDNNGQTPTFQLHSKIPDKDFDLRQRFGSGAFSTSFRLLSKTSGKTLRQEDYVIVLCSEPMEFYPGYTNQNGDTGHVLSDKPLQAIVYAGLRDEEFNYRKDCDEASATALTGKAISAASTR
jgi:hypothetical protein